MGDMSAQLMVVGKMFLLMSVGVVLRKRNIISREGKKILTDLVIDLTLPVVIISSFLIEVTEERLRATAMIFILSVLIEAVSLPLSFIAYRRCEESYLPCLKYGTVCSNSGLLGTPIAGDLFGSDAILIASMYCIPQRLVMWTIGLSFFTRQKGEASVRKIITHPCIASTILGIILMVTRCPIPALLEDCMESIGNCNTPLSLILVGSIIADMDLKLLHHRDAIYLSVIRLVVLPLISLGLCYLVQAPPLVRNVTVVLAAMPTGSSMPILALKYGGNESFASACTALTTGLSLVALPLWCALLAG